LVTFPFQTLPKAIPRILDLLPNSDQISQLEADAQLRIAYLLSRYPAVSHTFFLKEVLGLRERGLAIEVASINPPDRPRKDLPPIELAEANQTYCVKSGGFVSIALQLLSIALRHPGVTLRGLAAASCLGGWDLKARAFALFYLAEALLIGKWMQRRSLLHLHVHFGGPVATVGMLTSEAWQVPWSLTLHGPDEFFDQDAFYLRQKIESANFVICISDFCRSQVMRIAPEIGGSQLEIARLGVDCEALRPRRSVATATAKDTGPVRLVCTGRMVAAKGHRTLLEALEPLIAEGLDIRCTLIGDGPERASLEVLAKNLGISDRLSFSGSLEHQLTLKEVAAADIFVLASFAEGLPVALMEAMALGVPCVSTMIAAIPELIADGKNGLLVPASNVDDLQSALRRLIVDTDFRFRLGSNARKSVEEQYDLVANLDKLAALLKQKLSENL
jgi:glycosyltransferase involved in cell wall biosynthesis